MREARLRKLPSVGSAIGWADRRTPDSRAPPGKTDDRSDITQSAPLRGGNSHQVHSHRVCLASLAIPPSRRSGRPVAWASSSRAASRIPVGRAGAFRRPVPPGMSSCRSAPIADRAVEHGVAQGMWRKRIRSPCAGFRPIGYSRSLTPVTVQNRVTGTTCTELIKVMASTEPVEPFEAEQLGEAGPFQVMTARAQGVARSLRVAMATPARRRGSPRSPRRSGRWVEPVGDLQSADLDRLQPIGGPAALPQPAGHTDVREPGRPAARRSGGEGRRRRRVRAGRRERRRRRVRAMARSPLDRRAGHPRIGRSFLERRAGHGRGFGCSGGGQRHAPDRLSALLGDSIRLWRDCPAICQTGGGCK